MRWSTFANGARFPESLFQFKRRDRIDAVIEQVRKCLLLAQAGTPIERYTNRFQIGSAMLKLPPPLRTLIYVVSQQQLAGCLAGLCLLACRFRR